MMRPIQFRAWDASAKQMIAVGKLEFFTDGSIHVNDEHPACILMQFTGLHDYHGQPIYEGDICDDQFSCGQLFTVVWCAEEARFAAQKWDQMLQKFIDYNLLEKECKKSHIVGNRYEQPELLPHA